MYGSLGHPARLIPLVFLGAIAVGTALLSLPAAREPGAEGSLVTALFTAVSAVCVTGLAVVDTAHHWSQFGEFVIAALIQVGGFGIMAMSSLLALLVAGRLRLRDRLMAQAETQATGLGGIRKVVVRVAAIAVTVEVGLALILTARFAWGYDYSWDRAIWYGVFHAISAFNNAGFSLYSDSMGSFATDPLVNLPLSLAVIVGGIGSPVLVELLRRNHRMRHWSIHTKMTLAGTGILLAVGFVTYLVFEWSRKSTLGPLGVADKIFVSFFSSVMPRSAGFNILDMAELAPETTRVTEILMFIGGGSASTAGGIKVTTFFLLAFVIWAEIRGDPQVTAFRRTIPQAAQRQALTIALLGVAMVVLGTTVLQSLTELDFSAVLFETISAFGPVGLSMGITPDLPPAAQLVVAGLMYTGRVGVVTVAAALALRERGRRYRYPEARPIVG